MMASEFASDSFYPLPSHAARSAAQVAAGAELLDLHRSPPTSADLSDLPRSRKVLTKKLKDDDEAKAGATAVALYRSLDRSVDVFRQLRSERDRFNTSQRSLLKTLWQRYERYAPLRGARHVPSAVVILGGGPIGMRTAVEMALLGHSVTVLESRDTCSRLNVLKLWEEVISSDLPGSPRISPDLP